MLRSPRPRLTTLVAPMVLACGAWLSPVTGSAQTMQTVAAGHTSCTTSGGEGLSAQLVAVQTCLRPGQFVSFDNADINATSARVHLVAQASARDALQTAAATVPLQINSAFRPVSDQYLLWASGQCSVVATPGSSNHQSGRAVDVNNTTEARTALTNAGCVWFGSTDAVHYDCPGSDLRDDAVFAFQRLWNINNPGSPLDEDGLWGPMTRSAMDQSPAGGFTYGGVDACGPCPMGAELNLCGTCGAAPTEVCNGSDDDCDGMTDEGLLNACGGCGPAPTEVCNGRDDDCDGMTDEGCPTVMLDAGMFDGGMFDGGMFDSGPAAEDAGPMADASLMLDAGPGSDGRVTSGCALSARHREVEGDRGGVWMAMWVIVLGLARRARRSTLEA